MEAFSLFYILFTVHTVDLPVVVLCNKKVNNISFAFYLNPFGDEKDNKELDQFFLHINLSKKKPSKCANV